MESFTTVPVPGVPPLAVDCRRLLAIVRALDGDGVTLEPHGFDVTVASGRASYKLHGWNPDDFPVVPVTPELYAAEPGWGDVLGLAARLDGDRYGVRLAAYDGAVSVAATDGYRLVLRGATDGEQPFVIRATGLRALNGLDVTRIGTTTDWAFFSDGTVTVGVRRQSGDYPDVGRVLGAARDNATGTQVVIVAGSCDDREQVRVDKYTDWLEEAFRDYRGYVLSGGTNCGICGVMGSVCGILPAKGVHKNFHSVGYTPKKLPNGMKRDRGYDDQVLTKGSDFSPLEPLQMWADLLASRIKPSEVRVLGIGGGRIADFEYRLALALGATVGILAESGGTASGLLEKRLEGHEGSNQTASRWVDCRKA